MIFRKVEEFEVDFRRCSLSLSDEISDIFVIPESRYVKDIELLV